MTRLCIIIATLVLFGASAPPEAPAIHSSSPGIAAPGQRDQLTPELDGEASRRCAPRYSECRPGTEGNGGCYQPSSHFCSGGRVCDHGQSVCRRGGTGNGGCYTLGRGAHCEDGMMCPDFWSLCRRGALGAGGCYRPQQSTCNAGRITHRPIR